MLGRLHKKLARDYTAKLKFLSILFFGHVLVQNAWSSREDDHTTTKVEESKKYDLSVEMLELTKEVTKKMCSRLIGL